MKERFAQTMGFVEEYLRDVVCQRFPFSDKEKNKLTFEVTPGEAAPECALPFPGRRSAGSTESTRVSAWRFLSRWSLVSW